MAGESGESNSNSNALTPVNLRQFEEFAECTEKMIEGGLSRIE